MRQLLLALLLCSSSFVFAQTLIGQVVGVSDGDTATILTTERKRVKIRLAQIDAPEKSQAFGERSKQSLSDLIYGKNVSVNVETIDQYGRTVGKVFVGNMDANLEQVKRGMAWFYVQYGSDSSYRGAESKAKSARVGLWSDSSAIAPWDWRRGVKSVKATNLTPSSPPSSALSNVSTLTLNWYEKSSSALSNVSTLILNLYEKSSSALINLSTLILNWNEKSSPSPALINLTPSQTRFSCGQKQYCKEMSSCEEAQFYLSQCSATKIDGDHDGIPCERLCR